MNARVVPIAAWGVFAVVVLGSAAGAQTGPRRTTPSPSPTALAFTARAHVDVTVVTSDRTITGSAVLRVSQRANLTRVDVISVKTDVLPLPPVSLSFVIDRGARTVTAWSASSKRYYVQRMMPAPSAGPTPTPKPFGIFVGTSPFAKLDLLDVSVRMTGHTTTAGIATTGLALDGHFAKKGSLNVAHATATTQLADEYGAFPLTIDILLEPGAPAGYSAPAGVTAPPSATMPAGATAPASATAPPSAIVPPNAGGPSSLKLDYAVDQLTRAAPPIASFRVPAGYTKATSIMGVVFQGAMPVTPRSAH